MNNSRVSISGHYFTYLASILFLGFGLFPLLLIIEGIRLGESLEPFFRDVGPFILLLLSLSYVSYSFRTFVERKKASDRIFFSRQFLIPNLKFKKVDFHINQLSIKQWSSKGSTEGGGGSTDYTTILVDGTDFFTYTGKRKKILKVIPEVEDKTKKKWGTLSPKERKLLMGRHTAKVAKVKMESDEWLAVQPNELERVRNDTRLTSIIGLTLIILGSFAAWSNGDESRLEVSLLTATYMIIGGVGFMVLSLLVRTQYIEVRWIEPERTILIVKRGIFGGLFVPLVYQVMDGDMVVLDEDTVTDTGYDNERVRTETTYWLSIKRQNGELVRTNQVEGEKRQLAIIRDFILSHS